MEVNLESIAALTGILTSVVAIIISVIVHSQSQKLSENSIRPFLKIFCGCHNDNVYIRVANYGSGPAIITGISIKEDKSYLDNNDVKSLAHYVWSKFKNEENADVYREFDSYIPFKALENDRPVSADGELVLVKFYGENEDVQKIKQCLSKLTIELEYMDIFGKKIASKDMQENMRCRLVCADVFEDTSSDNGPVLMKRV